MSRPDANGNTNIGWESCVTAFLFFWLIGTPLIIVQGIAAGWMVDRLQSEPAPWAVRLLALCIWANPFFGLAIWRWRKWGAYGIVASAAVAFAIAWQVSWLFGLFGAAWLAILAFLLRLRPLWREPAVVWMLGDDPTFGRLSTNRDRLRAVNACRHNDRGVEHYERGEYDEAIRALRKAVAGKPDYAMAHQNLANAMAMKGMQNRSPGLVRQAIWHMRRAIEICPDFERAKRNLATLEANLGTLEEVLR